MVEAGCTKMHGRNWQNLHEDTRAELRADLREVLTAALEAGRSGEAVALEAARADLRAAAATLRETLDRLWPSETAPQQPPPVGVTDALWLAVERLQDDAFNAGVDGRMYDKADALAKLKAALSHQQPAGRHPMDASYTPKAHRQQPAPSVSEERDRTDLVSQQYQGPADLSVPSWIDDENPPALAVSEPAASGEGLIGFQQKGQPTTIREMPRTTDRIKDDVDPADFGIPEAYVEAARHYADFKLDEARRLTTTGQGDVEWRWVDEKGRAMTEWKAGNPPPMAAVADEKGVMRVEVRPFGQQQEGQG